MNIKRTIQTKIEKELFQGRAIIIYGPRRVGKTTLIRRIADDQEEKSLYLNCDEPDVREKLSNRTSTELKRFIGSAALVLIDEAQRVPEIGLTIKLLVDNYPEMQLLITGSSSFALSNSVVEPLTGRKSEFHLHPFSMNELSTVFSPMELNRMLPELLIRGSYPDIVLRPEEAEANLQELCRSYLYKDILSFADIRNSEALDKLLKALALQIGNEVSYPELAQVCGIDKHTVAAYIRILEQAFIIFRLGPFSRNLRNELKKMRKIYFLDVGIRNALIRNLNPPELRADSGHLWENLAIAERIRHNSNRGNEANYYFWRTHQQQEIDFIEERNGQLHAYELKWSPSARWKVPPQFKRGYPEAEVTLVTPDNWQGFVGF